MSDQTETPAEKWMIKVVGGLVATIIGTRLFGGDIEIASAWYALLGVAVVYVLAFLMLFLAFDLSAKEAAKKVTFPAIALLLALAPGRVLWVGIKVIFFFAVFLWAAMWAVLFVGAILMKASGKKSIATWKEARGIFLSFTFWKERVTQILGEQKAIPVTTANAITGNSERRLQGLDITQQHCHGSDTATEALAHTHGENA